MHDNVGQLDQLAQITGLLRLVRPKPWVKNGFVLAPLVLLPTCALVLYGMFVISSRPQLVITVRVVLFGLFRYWYVVDGLDGGECPTDTPLSDWSLLTLIGWIDTCLWALWPA